MLPLLSVTNILFSPNVATVPATVGNVTEPNIPTLPVNWCVSVPSLPNLVEPDVNIADDVTYVV